MTGKLYNAQFGFPTPDDIPETLGCRQFSVPDDPVWFALLMGALLPLQDPKNWYEWGALTAEDAAVAWQEIIAVAYEATCASGEIEAPYWDDEDGGDAAEEAPVDDQPWYDTLADVVVTSFLATIITPAAAVEFVTTARKIRIAFRKGSWGGIFKIFMDGDEVATIDTYAPADALDYVDVLMAA